MIKTYPTFVNGNWETTLETLSVMNPATGDEFARISTTSRARVAQAIADAHEAFFTWRRVPGRARGELLARIANEVERRREEIARLITFENGKPISQSQGEVALALDHLRWFAGEARRIYGRIPSPQVDEKRHLVIKTPVGVVGAISPWNFPLMLAVRKIAPALAAGCTVILKPSSRTPLCAVAFAECVAAVEPPHNVFQLVVGSASEIGAEFLENPLCRKITFTGSTEVGQKLIAGAAAHVKPLSLELGGNAPLLVFEDCDLDTAVKGTMMAKFRNSGQSCIAANRIYVQRGVYDKFVEQLTEKVRFLNVNDGLDPTSQVGPLIDQDAIIKATEHVNDAMGGGAKLLCGGNPMPRAGFFFEPTVLADVNRNSLCMFEETFAPIAAVCAFENEKEAVELANNSTHGLSAYVFTRDLSRIFRLMELLDVGTIGVNDGLPTTSQSPFGGVKQSGWGRELGTEGIDAFLETKHVSIDFD